MKEKPRYLFFDLLRGLSLIVMMEAHVFNAFMQENLRSTWWFGIMNYANGLVAPAFLFVSGAVFYLSAYGKTDELRKFGPSFRKKIYRIGLILLAGYSLHLPFLSLEKMVNQADHASLLHFYSVDILQCIAAGLLLILILKVIIKKEEIFLFVTAVIFVVIVFTSFLVWQQDLSVYLPVYIADYFTPKYGSLFPLLPWLAFLLAGVIFAYYFLRTKESGKEDEFIKIIFTAGIITAAAGHLLLSELFLPVSIRTIRPNPIFILQRTGYVLVFISLCWYYFQKKGETKSYITIVGKESLIVYWLHLQILFRQFYSGKSIASSIHNSFDGLQSLFAFIFLVLLMIFAAVLWNKFKLKMPYTTKLLTGIIVWGCILIFFLF